MNPVHKQIADWTAQAIEKCRQDPELKAMEEAGIWCNVCAMHRPCICDMQTIAAKMRDYYNSQLTTDFLGRKHEIVRSDCSLHDRVMCELVGIAIKEYEKMCGRSEAIWGQPNKQSGNKTNG